MLLLSIITLLNVPQRNAMILTFGVQYYYLNYKQMLYNNLFSYSKNILSQHILAILLKSSPTVSSC